MITTPPLQQRGESPLGSGTCSPSSGLARIRRNYGVPAKRGMIISYGETPFPIKCLIVGSASSDRLRARCERPEGGWSKRTILLHPTWAIQYPENSQAQSSADALRPELEQ